ncbi:DUF6252 family protein [Flavobacterium sp. CS20]|uniref:DUF6252 family protein n=1 Tax=Flavobacterium sp. CS20 TaxID=2775246 RepID=UPI001B39F9CC|nr:DUF6252 family protein [Flavobacterium sp. CS20]QTY27811.1 hypothetical protein IGB25_04630 [Flavobacterium sp. CS20]
MKTKLKTLSLILLCIFLISCSSDDDNSGGNNSVNQLPEATQIGANTAGALVDGQPITPKGGGINPNLIAFYQFVDGAYFFNVGILNSENNITKSIKVFANENIIEEDEVYTLNKDDNSVGYGGNYSILSNETDSFYFTNTDFTGELIITHLDEQNRIVSGTFWFDAVNEDGEVVEVREGRFDVTYSQ